MKYATEIRTRFLSGPIIIRVHFFFLILGVYKKPHKQKGQKGITQEPREGVSDIEATSSPRLEHFTLAFGMRNSWTCLSCKWNESLS